LASGEVNCIVAANATIVSKSYENWCEKKNNKIATCFKLLSNNKNYLEDSLVNM